MKLLYYSTALFASHGGSNQSKQFLAHARKNKNVSEIIVFPQQRRLKDQIAKSRNWSFLKTLKRSKLLQIGFFFRKQKFYLHKLSDTILNEKPDAIVFQVDSTHLQVRFLKRKFPNVVLATVINASAFDEPFRNIAWKDFFRKQEAETLSLSDLNVFVSDFLRKHVMNRLMNAQRDLVVHNGVDFQLFFPRSNFSRQVFDLKFSKEDFVIGYCGTLDQHKKIENLVSAFKVTLDKHPNVKLMIIGGGREFKKLQEMICDLGIESSVFLTGWVDHKAVPEFLGLCDMGVHHYASLYMSPIKLFEYMAMKLPVIGPDIPAVREIFQNRRELLLTTGDVEDLAAKMDLVIRDREFAASIASKGYERVLQNFSWRNHADAIINGILTYLENTSLHPEVAVTRS